MKKIASIASIMIATQLLSDGYIRVSTDLKDANITLDGKVVGQTNGDHNDFPVENGKHVVEIFKKDALKIYKDTQEITIEDSDAKELVFKIKPTLTTEGQKQHDAEFGHLEEIPAANAGKGYTTIVDSKNGLMWEGGKVDLSHYGTWNEAVEYCKNLEYSSFDDWRLPSLYEFAETVKEVDRGDMPGTTMRFTYDIFKMINKNGYMYWTSTATFDEAVASIDTRMKAYNKGKKNKFRCVRGKKIERKPLVNLEFIKLKEVIPTRVTSCETIKPLGKWRILTFKEAVNLIDAKKKLTNKRPGGSSTGDKFYYQSTTSIGDAVNKRFTTQGYPFYGMRAGREYYRLCVRNKDAKQ